MSQLSQRNVCVDEALNFVLVTNQAAPPEPECESRESSRGQQKSREVIVKAMSKQADVEKQ